MKKKTTTKPFYNATIPSEWEVKKFQEFAKFYSGGTPLTTKAEYYGGDIPFIKSGEIYFDKTEQFISEKGLKNSSAKMVDKGDLLYALYGANSGEVAISQIKGAINQAILCIKHNENCDTIFIYNFLLSKKESIIRNYLQGGQGNLSAEIIKSLLIPIPPLPEQKAIAHILGLMDTAINKNNSLIAKKELQKKWLMQNILTGKQRLRGFDKDWKMYRIEELFEKVFRYVEWSDESLYKLVSLRRRYGGLFERGDFFGSQIEVKKIKSINHKDFLISKRQVSHGAWGIVTPEFHDRKVSDEYDSLIVKDNGKLLVDFWDWFSKIPLLNHYAFLASNGVHIEKLIFDFDTFKRRRVLIPSTIEEQTAIAQVLQAADKEIQLLKVKTEKLREQKKGLMQVLLTGKKKIRN